MIGRRDFIGGCAALGATAGCKTAMFGDGPVRFGMITDLHYAEKDTIDFGGANGSRYYRQSCEKLAECVMTMNRLSPDFLIELGDFKDQSADKGKTLACLDRIEKVFAGFKGDRYHVLGNHEMDCLSKPEVLSHIWNAGAPAEAHYAFTVGGVTFAVLDGCYNSKMQDYFPGNWDWTDANIPPAQLAWLEDVLAQSAGPAVVFCHQRIDDKAGGAHGLKNAAAVRRVLEKSGKVKSVYTGHEHGGGFRELNGISYYTLRAAVIGDYAADVNSYALVTVEADGSSSVKLCS
ncbi:MAG: metallophosphoesterase [Kiritimatiellae bacterium]|nr:metallophosphoesterase [Kiritimatiellia bacterium]